MSIKPRIRLIPRFRENIDFDENGIFYALGTQFGTTKYSNPAKIGLVQMNSTKLKRGNVYDFIGREKVEAYTQHKENSFFSISFKQRKVKPNAYTLMNGKYKYYYMKSWNFEGSNDGKTWQILSKHKDDTSSLNGQHQSKTWKVWTDDSPERERGFGFVGHRCGLATFKGR